MDDGSGAVTVIPAWMLDPIVCMSMKLGEPRVAVSALRELHHLLIEGGLRGSSPNDSTLVQEECDEFDLPDHSTAASGTSSNATSGQPGLYFSSTIRGEPIPENESTELSGQPSDVGRLRHGSGGQR